MKVLAVIPARGGSKAIPRKNIRPFLGRPLLAWIIESAKGSKFINRIIVSTDDPKIAKIAKKEGAEAPFLRPKKISQDFSTDVEFLIHALDWLKENEGYEPDIVLRLPPTSPLCRAKHIDEGIQKLIDMPDADSVRPITEVHKHPYKMWKISKDGRWLEPFLPKSFTGFDEPHNLPRQSFPTVYIHTGAMDIMRLRTIRELKSTSGTNIAYFFMDPEDSINIDSPLDFKIAEMLMKKKLA